MEPSGFHRPVFLSDDASADKNKWKLVSCKWPYNWSKLACMIAEVYLEAKKQKCEAKVFHCYLLIDCSTLKDTVHLMYLCSARALKQDL